MPESKLSSLSISQQSEADRGKQIPNPAMAAPKLELPLEQRILIVGKHTGQELERGCLTSVVLPATAQQYKSGQSTLPKSPRILQRKLMLGTRG